MLKGKWVPLVVLFSLLCLATLTPAGAQVVHENPAALTAQQPFDVNGKLTLQLGQMFGSLDDIALRINGSDFGAARLSLGDFEQYYGLFKDYVGRMNLSGSDYQRLLGQANLTAGDLRTLINSSEAFNASMARFDRYWQQGDRVNATIAAAEAQQYLDTMNGSSRQLTAGAAAISGLLQNTSVDTDHLDSGVDLLNALLGRAEARDELPKGLLGNTSLTLNASQDSVGTGDLVLFTARLSSDNGAVGGGLISLYVDGVPVANATTAADGTCALYHIVRGGSFARTFTAIAYYDPQGAGYAPAVSNEVALQRLTVIPALTLDLTPAAARFGDTVHLGGRLTADGYPVPDHPVSLYFPGRPACIAMTSDNGSFDCDIDVTAEIKAGPQDIVALYETVNVPGDALANATSPPATLTVAREATSLALASPLSVLRGGDNASFAGTLASASGRPVAGEEVSIYAGDVRLGSADTDAAGHYDLSLQVPLDLTAGIYPVYAAYSPPDGMSLAGSQSDSYAVTFAAVPPTVTVYGIRLIAFQGDRMDLLVNVTANGRPVDGSELAVNMSGLTLGNGKTDGTGNYYLANQISGSAGLQTITVSSTGNGLLGATTVDTGMVLIMPFDLPTSLAIIVAVLIVAGLVLARVARTRRGTSRRQPALKTPLPKPTLPAAPLPAPPAERAQPPITRFEDEIARIDGIIAGGAGSREVIAEIYRAARRIAGRNGIAVPDSATHREFFRGLAAKEPSLVAPAGTISRHYESATFGHVQPKDQDIAASLTGLKEIDARMSGEDRGGSP